MYHIVEQVEGVFEVWFQCDEFDYVWQHIGDYDSYAAACDEVSCLSMFVKECV